MGGGGVVVVVGTRCVQGVTWSIGHMITSHDVVTWSLYDVYSTMFLKTQQSFTFT